MLFEMDVERRPFAPRRQRSAQVEAHLPIEQDATQLEALPRVTILDDEWF